MMTIIEKCSLQTSRDFLWLESSFIVSESNNKQKIGLIEIGSQFSVQHLGISFLSYFSSLQCFVLDSEENQ